jgi:hypothetical protein
LAAQQTLSGTPRSAGKPWRSSGPKALGAHSCFEEIEADREDALERFARPRLQS